MACEHLKSIRSVQPRTDGCEDCLRIGGRWVSLRECLTCGHVGCCDSSPNRHATQHFHQTQHPIAQAIDEGGWGWCYVDALELDASDLPAVRAPEARV